MGRFIISTPLTLRWRAAGPTWVMTTPSSGEVRNASVPVQIEIDFDRLPPRTHHERLQFIDLERPDDTQAIRLDVNRTPRFEPIAPQRVLAGVFIEFRVSVTDPDLDNVTLSIDDLPDGAMFDATTGLFNWRTRREQAGQYALKFRARDDFEASAEAQEIVEIELLKELEFTLRLFPGETQMIHVPFRDPRFGRISDLFTFLQPQVEAIIFFNDVREIFRAYTSHSHPNSSDDLVLEPWTGFVIVNRSTAPLRDVIFRGQSYAETDIPLKRGKLRRNGINLIGLPLRDPRIQTMTDLGSLHPSIINVIGKVPQGRFRDVPADEFFITGGQSFIVIVSADTTLSLSGAPWENAAFSNPFIANAPDALARSQHIPTLLQPKSALLPNYPNPFNPETWLPFRLAENSQVTIQIYSMSGEIVRTLDLGWKASGDHVGRGAAAYWDGRNDFGEKIASDIYFYTMIARNQTGQSELLQSPHKLLLLK